MGGSQIPTLAPAEVSAAIRMRGEELHEGCRRPAGLALDVAARSRHLNHRNGLVQRHPTLNLDLDLEI